MLLANLIALDPEITAGLQTLQVQALVHQPTPCPTNLLLSPRSLEDPAIRTLPAFLPAEPVTTCATVHWLKISTLNPLKESRALDGFLKQAKAMHVCLQLERTKYTTHFWESRHFWHFIRLCSYLCLKAQVEPRPEDPHWARSMNLDKVCG